MLRRRHGILLFALFFLTTQGACYMGGPERREEIRRTFELKAGGRIILTNLNGSLQVEGWDQNKVEVLAVKHAHGYSERDAEENLKRLEISFEQQGNDLTIDTHYPRHSRFGEGVSYTLRAPRKVNLDLRTTNGSVTVTDVEGRMQIKSTNGSLKAENVGGSVRGTTTNGAITVNLVRFSGEDLHLSSTNGAIRLHLPDDVNADLSAHTTNGRVHTDFPITTQGIVGKRSLQGTLGKGGAQIQLHTTNGSITISRISGSTA